MVADYLAVCRNGVGLITLFISCSTSKKLNNIKTKEVISGLDFGWKTNYTA